MLVFLLVMVGDLIGILAVTPSWQGMTRVIVTPGAYHDFSPFSSATRPIGASQAPIGPLDLVEMLQSRELAAQLVRQYDLDKLPPARGLRGRVQRAADWLGDVPGMVLSVITRAPMKKLTPFDQAVDDFLSEREDISQEQDTNIVNIGVWGESPKLANNLANSLAQALIEKEKEASRQQAAQAYEYGVQELGRAEGRLAEALRAQKEFRQRQHFSEPQQEAAAARDRLERLRAKSDATREELVSAEAQLGKTSRQLAGEKEMVVAAQVLATNPVVKQIRADLIRQEVQLAGLLQEKQEAHPAVQELRAQMAQNQAKLKSEAERVVDTETTSTNPTHQQLLIDSLMLDAQVQGLKAQQQVQDSAVQMARSELDALAAKSAEFERLDADVRTATEVASQLRLSVQQLSALRNTDTSLSGTGVRIVEQSDLPDEEPPDSPMALVDLAAGLVAGVVLSLALALLIDYWQEGPVGVGPAGEAERTTPS
ncbi:MAG: GumC family protein [Armatimonadota bacterium]